MEDSKITGSGEVKNTEKVFMDTKSDKNTELKTHR